MQSRMVHHSWYRTDDHVDSTLGVALGRVSLGFVQTASQPCWNADRQVCIVMSGELHGNHNTQYSNSHAQLLLDGYLRDGRQFLSKLNGEFVAAIWDNRTNQLILTNDRFGMKPLYYAHVAEKLLFASEIKALLADPDLPRGLHTRGIAQFFAFGQNFCEDTFLSAVRTLPAAAWLVYYRDQDILNISTYRRSLETTTAAASSQSEYHDRLSSAFARAVQVRSDSAASLGISLSGGLDSRTILALVPQQTPIKCVSMGMAGSLDHACAAKLAELSHRQHYRCMLDQQYLANFEQHLRHMVHLTDGHYLDQCIVIPTLPRYRELGIQVLLRGHAGELMHMDKAYNFSLDDDGWRISDKASLRKWLKAHLTGYIMDGLPGPLFKNIAPEEVEQFTDQSLNDALVESDDSGPPLHQVWRLFITQRLRRETAMSMAKIGTWMETRLPFMDNDVIDTLLAAPPEWKRGDETQLQILKRYFPKFLDVVNANTGTWLGAGRLRRRVSTLRMKILGKLGVPGYQPYERLGLWLRRELRPFVERILLDDRTLERGVFQPETVGAVVKNHMEQRHNHTALLLAMLIFEVGQREFVDGDYFVTESELAAAAN